MHKPQPLTFISKSIDTIPMRLAISYVLASISLVLLIIYGADVAVGGGAGGDGFLPFDSMVRGVGFGIPPVILSIAAFVLSLRISSIPLGGIILAVGILIVIGGAISIATVTENAARAAGEGGSLLAIGAVIAALGGIKIWKSA